MTTYEEYRKGFELVIREQVRTEPSVFAQYINKVYSIEVKEEIARLEKISKAIKLYDRLGHDEFVDCFETEARAMRALQNGGINMIEMSEIEYRLSK